MFENKKSESKLIGAIVASIMLLSVIGSIGAIHAEELPDDVPDQGEFWSLTINMIFAGADAETIEWDFGDESPISTEWNPSHTYSEPGNYIVTQTVWNSFEGGSTSTAQYLLRIMGDPYVDIVQPEGAPVIERIYSPIRTAPEQPEDPVWEGHDFIGWFADAEFTVPFDWTDKLMSSVTAYAAYSGYAPVYHTITVKDDGGSIVETINVQEGASIVIPEPPIGKVATYYVDSELTTEFDWSDVTEDVTIYRILTNAPVTPDEPDEPEETEHIINGTEIVLLGGGILLLLVGLTTRRPVATIIALILMGIAITGVLDIIEIPNIFEFRKG